MSEHKAIYNVTSFLGDVADGIRKLEYSVHADSDGYNHEKELAQLNIDKIAQKLQRCKDAYMNGIDSIEEYSHNKALLSKELEEARMLLDKYETPVIPDQKSMDEQMLKRIKSAYDVLTNESVDKDAKSHAIRSVCEKVMYDKKNERLDFFLYFRA